MDELVIDDKKYISSKRAAKITGYAKDYVGQLCREGRVKARLVGRSWYVLESSIRDHKAGDTDGKKSKAAAKGKVNQSLRSKGILDIPPSEPNLPALVWEAPRYESYVPENVPSINLIQKEPGTPVARAMPTSGASTTTENSTSQVVNDAWKAWFNNRPIPSPTNAMDKHFELMGTSEFPDVVVKEPEPAAEPDVEDPTERIPLHIVEDDSDTESNYQEPLPRPQSRRKGRGMRIILRIIFLVVAVSCALVAALNSGYLDQYLNKYTLHYQELNTISGSTIYSK